MSIIVSIALVILLAIAAFVAWRVFRGLKASEQRGTLPDQGDDERPEHLAVGTSDQIAGMERAREREAAERR